MDAAIVDFVTRYGYAMVLVSAIIDGTGFPFPGRLLLVVTGAIADRAQLRIPIVIAMAATGALIGDHVWYLAGKLDRKGRILGAYCRAVPAGTRCVDRAREYLQRYGPMAFVVGRLFAAVRMLTVPIAVSAGISYRQFLLYDALGALTWSATFVLLGYGLGAQAPALVDRMGLVGAVIAGATVLTVAVVLLRRRHAAP